MNKKNNEVIGFTSLFNYDCMYYKVGKIYSISIV